MDTLPVVTAYKSLSVAWTVTLLGRGLLGAASGSLVMASICT
jgi:hypothetical protein